MTKDSTVNDQTSRFSSTGGCRTTATIGRFDALPDKGVTLVFSENGPYFFVEKRSYHRENAGTLGMVPLIIKPIYTFLNV